MKNYQNQLIELLNSYLKQELIEYNSPMSFEEIIKEAESHKIEEFIYQSIKKNKIMDKCPSELLDELKKHTILTAINQKNHIIRTGEVLSIFKEHSIPVIVLKGLVVRELYANPDLRTMGDADILVHEHNLNRVNDILIELGYREDSRNSSHVVYKHNNFKTIEVHWTLVNEVFFRGNVENFEKNLWNNAVEVKVSESTALSLGLEDLAIHLFIHMATHIVGSGFGIRQLCDLVLLLDKEEKNINWSYFKEGIEECGVSKFTGAIFGVCNKLFGTKIPKEVSSIGIDKIVVDELTKDIFESGVFGRKDLSKMFANQLACNFAEEGNDTLDSVYKRFLSLLFPPIDEMDNRYDYAKKNKVLSPVAWGHHLVNGALNTKYSMKDKINFAKSSVKSSTKRNKLIKRLEL
ncbi:nucleotidyltransferase domain-containing protein [Clostridium tarantellae]|uniref:Nucleotidyltransferase family protein n=1 Tax=Clostridium tarantellae TaxID=39493 RepID=A0A6I1MGG2_9CLOT|nr:nucleotidyltransferase family protein [Clostridium tarantellae]MPQ42616.1 hypothetical protein [Clostridium tarantellae]